MVAACLKPCERTGLIDGMGEEFSLDIGVKKKSFCNFTRLCWFLVFVAVVAFIVVVFTTDSIDNMNAQKQIDLLNADTISAGSEVPSMCQSTLLLMRHCEYTTEDGLPVEDEYGNQHCSDIGLQRAEYIPTLFGDDAKWPLPTKLYAMKRDRKGVREGDDQVNLREVETLTPLSKEAGVDIDVVYSDGGERQLAFDFFKDLASGGLCDKSTVVSWQDKRIATLAQALGCGENQGCPDKYKKRDFDKVWQLTYTYWESEEDDEEGEEEETTSRRELRKKKKKTKKTITFEEGWNVHGRVVKEHFLPLEK